MYSLYTGMVTDRVVESFCAVFYIINGNIIVCNVGPIFVVYLFSRSLSFSW